MGSGVPKGTSVVALGVVAALIGVAAGFGLVVWFSGGQSDGPVQSAASMADVQLSDAPDVAPSPPAPSPDTASEPSTDAGQSADARSAEGELAACLEAGARADAAVGAARTALGNWNTHFGAQIAFDRGQIDSAEAKRRWAESKEPAERNLQALATARRAVPDGDPCEGIDVDSLDTDERGCVARANGVADVLAAAGPALDGWSDHLNMMATRDEYPVDEYLAIWRRTVAAAPADMREFQRSADAYDGSADCAGRQQAAAVGQQTSRDVASVSHVAVSDADPAAPLCVLTRVVARTDAADVRSAT